jgi:hypothetical protein
VGFKRSICATFLLGVSYAQTSVAGSPPLDRPTPPPCCADGLCYPNYSTYGWYPTRWRRWPTEPGEHVPTPGQPPAPLGPDLRPYETPPPEEEDRRAPPPSMPPRAEEAAVAPPASEPGTSAPTGQPPTETPRTTEPTPPGSSTPPAPLFEPIEETPPTAPLNTTPSTRLPLEPGPTTTPPFEDDAMPTSDLDPPPALPFRTPVIVTQPDIRSPGQPKLPDARPPRAQFPGPVNDPPPALPVVMASRTR